jgi:hypothetical protein
VAAFSPGVAKVFAPILEALPIEQAMPELVPSTKAKDPAVTESATRVARDLQAHPELEAALWLYVDDLDRAHSISQGLESPEGSYLHGVMHRREGDFSNANYWFRLAAPFRLSHDPFEFVDSVKSDAGANAPALLERQREEWLELVRHCGSDL